MRRSILILAGCISFVVASLAFITADEPKYKNLKILKKDITKKEMDSIMHFFSVAVGEKCGFCHVRNAEAKTMDFASDDNPHKNVTRSMMRMTTKINQKYFKDEENKGSQLIEAVTCFTCHRGEGHPATKPAPRRDSISRPPGGMKPFPGDSMKNFQRDSVHTMPVDSLKMQH